MPSDVGEGMCGSVIGICDDWVIGVKIVEHFEFMHELVRLRSVSTKDLGFTSLEDDFITSDRDDYVRGCIRKGVRVWWRSGWRPGALVLGYDINRGWWHQGSDWNRCQGLFMFWGCSVFVTTISGGYVL